MKNYLGALLAAMIVLAGLSNGTMSAAEMKLIEKDGGVEPFVKDFKYTGGSGFRIIYGWAVTAKMEKAWTLIFVHITKEQDPEIVAQNDHYVSSPATEWKVDSIVTDGPFDVALPATIGEGVYDIYIGMVDNKNTRNDNMKGLSDNQTRFIIGRLTIKGTTGNITDIKFDVPKGVRKPDFMKNN